ncbi:BLUF domain-containing protein [Neptunomonas sp. XY-337]|uniref:BLUF domain-containing protein n=1 Tax=Neptunomonas sp. XY-337 TaxID=2561897 RepID=UPI0010AADF05|nr:BLUF domain-containing protein [Neptunomonas sp. XY-337]
MARAVRLVYYSKATRDMSLSDLRDILQTARDNNGDVDVCGMLCYDNRYFLQALEGERAVVNELYLDIADDARHDEIIIISYAEVEKPTFEQWKMGYSAGSDAFYRLLKENGQREFEPAAMSAEQAVEFLTAMAAFQTEV